MRWFRKKAAPGPRPDYSAVDSLDKVQRLVAAGELVPLLLLPEDFGGQAIKENTVYVPPFAADMKEGADRNIIGPLAAEGKVTRYRAEPEYAGTSFVPIAIKLVATEPANFTYDVAIWGAALGRDLP